MSTAEALESNHLYRRAWTLFAQASRSGEVIDQHGIVAVTAGVSWPATNLAFLQSPVSTARDLAERIEFGKRFFADRHRAWLFVMFNDWISPSVHARAVLNRHGLTFVQESIGMLADRLSAVDRPLPTLAFHLVNGGQALCDFASINAESYGIPPAWTQETVVTGPHWDSPTMAYIGYQDGEPVTTAMTRPIGEVLFVGWVATTPAKRRQGCAEAIIRHALAQQQTGAIKSALHATPQALPLYQRLGYRSVSRFELHVGGLPKS